MVGQEGERSSLVKVAGLGIVVVLLIAGAVYVVGELVDDKITNINTDYDESYEAGESPQAVGENDENLPDWLIPKKNLLGKEYFEIDREKLPLEIEGLKLVEGNDDKYDDGVMKPNDGVPEMMMGFDKIAYVELDGTETIYDAGVLLVDNDFFKKYDEVLAQCPAWGGELLLDKENVFTEIADGVFFLLVPANESRYSAGDNSIFSPVIAYEKK